MSWNNKVVWSEGMFLQPQHFQQHDRYLANSLEQRVGELRPFSHGFTKLQIDEALIKQGKIALIGCSGVMPDGTPFSLPEDDDLPAPIDIAGDIRNTMVVLALPTKRQGITETSNETGPDNFARHGSSDVEVQDSNGLGQPAWVQIGKLRMRLALQPQVVNAHSTMGVVRVVERRPDNSLVLDSSYIPPLLSVRVSPVLQGYIDDVNSILSSRSAAVAQRLNQPGVAGAAEIADFLLLQMINRVVPLFNHMSLLSNLHPEDFYRQLVQLAGETKIFAQNDKLPPKYVQYKHDDLQASFLPVIADVRKHLAVVMDSHAIKIDLQDRQYGIRVGSVPDTELLKSAAFVLAVNADMPAEVVRANFPAQVKMGPVEKIRDLVNLQLPGIVLRPLSVAPRQLPFHAGYTYFELDRGSELWKNLTATGFAMHVAGNFPGLQMEFWAIRR